jgi:cobyrinic acid a,c-diamide synthase
MKGFLIAGTASGVGKTTVSLAIMAAMRERGLVVQAFKGGPDFLDTGHHTRISGRIARNVDTWMLSTKDNIDCFSQASAGADLVVVEGMMGLFDGKSGDSEAGSSAEIAKLLRLPVVLVVDAGKSVRSVAAVVLGFELFDPELPLAGVILNRVAGERHYRMLEAAIGSRCKTPLLGWMPREPAISIPERHLGLHTAEEYDEAGAERATAQQIETLSSLAEKHLILEPLMSLECGLTTATTAPSGLSEGTPIRVGVASDRAFSFYYEDNLDLLRQQGALIVPFSPIHNASLPDDLDMLYLGGGYPELYAQHLSSNASMLASIKAFIASGKPVYAECGGMMYLSQQLTAVDGTAHRMAGVLPFSIEMTRALVDFGYVSVELTQDCILGKAGTTIRGHSFHHSRIVGGVVPATSYRIEYSLSGRQVNEGYSIGNVLATYIHLHFRAAPSIALSLMNAARAQQRTEVSA